MDPFDFVRRSYDQLLNTREGYLERALRDVRIIRSDSGKWEMILREVNIERPRYGERECALRGLSLASLIKPTVQQIIYDDNAPPAIENIREQELYSGEMPLPTSAGTLVIDGAPRVVRGELGPCVGFAPFDRGWRYGNEWGDCLEFVAAKDGVQLTYRLAEDSISAMWTGEPPAMVAKGKRTSLEEPALPAKLVIRTRADIEDFLGRYPLPPSSQTVIAPQSLFERSPDESWSSEDFARVLDWVRTDEAEKLRRDSVTPVRVLGPGLILARWLRRGLFLTAMDALDRGDTISFGPRAKPKRKRDFEWMPHDVWNTRPLAALVRTRAESEAHTPAACIASAVSVASLHRSLRVPAFVDVPDGWLATSSKKLTLAELPLCEMDSDGHIVRPDRFSARTIRSAMRVTASDSNIDPLPIAEPDVLAIDPALSSSIARATLAARSFERATEVLAKTADALAVRTERGVDWIELSPESSQNKRRYREQFTAPIGTHEPGARFTDTLETRDGLLAIGKLLRVGFDLRVTKGAAWVSTARINDAMDAMRAANVESVLRDTRLGREEWSDQLTTDSLADVGSTATDGATLATVLVPTDDATLSPEDRLLRAIDGTPMGPAIERPVRWSGPTATIVARTVMARRGVDDVVSVVRSREARMRALSARAEACASIADESLRESLLEAVREDEYNAGRGYDMPPGVIAIASWLLAWRAPLAVNSALSLRDDTRLTVENVTADRFFEGAEQVDLLVHPSMREAVAALGERGAEIDSMGAQSSDAAPVCYVLRSE